MKTYSKSTYYCLALALVLWSNTTLSDTAEFKNRVIETVLNQTPHAEDEEITVNILQFDESWKLKTCQSPLTMNLSKPRFSNQNNVVVISCNDTEAWDFFVPIQIQIMTSVLTSNRTIKPGEFITENDLVYDKVDKNQLHDGYFTDKNNIIGLTPIRVHQAGAVFTQKNLKRTPLIKKNQMVNLALKTDGIEIYMTGITKSDGYKNEIIKIMNPSSKKIVDAIVIDREKAQIIY